MFLELAGDSFDGNGVGVRFVVGGVREDARAGGVRDLGQLVEVVVGVLDAGRGVAVGDGVVDLRRLLQLLHLLPTFPK